MKDFLSALRLKAWRTAGARYNAARRLKRREFFSTASLAMFSSLSVAVAFVQRIYAGKLGAGLDDYFSMFLACLGVFILAISLIEWGAANGLKADMLHRNAEELTAFHIKLAQKLAQLDSGSPIDWPEVEKLREEYEVIKGRCSANHMPLDDQLFKVTNRLANEFKDNEGKPQLNGFDCFIVNARWFISSIWFFAILWLVVGAGILTAIWIAK